MTRIAVLLLSSFLIVSTGCGRGGKPSAKPTAPVSPAKTEWKLLSGLAILRTSIDVCSDRKFAVVWGQRASSKDVNKSCWLIDLQTAEIEDLLTKCDGKAAAIVRDSERLSFSPDGTHLLICAQEAQGACILDLSTHKFVVLSGPGWDGVLWIGNRLLLPSSENSNIYNMDGELQERSKLHGYIIASDPTGTKLLSGFPQNAIVNPEGKVLRSFGGEQCDKERPLLSRSGNWAGMFCEGKDGWAYSLASTTTDEVLRLRRPWGATFALTDNGNSIFEDGEGNGTFGAVMTGGQAVEATTVDVRFWPKDDDPWKSTKGAPTQPSPNDIIWNSMPSGKSQIIAKKAMALTLLGKELFLVQAEGDERTLKAIPLPEK